MGLFDESGFQLPRSVYFVFVYMFCSVAVPMRMQYSCLCTCLITSVNYTAIVIELKNGF